MEEEGPLRSAAGDEIRGLARKGIGEVRRFLDRLAVAVERVVGVVVGLVAAEVIGVDETAIGRSPATVRAAREGFAPDPGRHALVGSGTVVAALVEKAVEFIVAAAQGMKGRGAAEVPFADEGGGVAGLVAEAVGEGLFGGGQADPGLLVAGTDGIELEAETRLVTPRDHPRPRGRAEGGGDVGVRETDPVLRDGIEVGRGHVGGGILRRGFPVTEIVGDDEDDVGGWVGGGEWESKSKEKEHRRFHGARVAGAARQGKTASRWRRGRHHYP